MTSDFMAIITVGSCIASVFLLAYLSWLTQKRLRLIKRLEKLRYRIARDLHDDIGATLSSIALYNEAARQRTIAGKTAETLEVLDQIGQNVREVAENMSDIVWMVNPKNDRMQYFLERIEDYGKRLAGARNIRFGFEADEAIYKSELGMDAQKDYYLICKEALNNMAKYSNCTMVNFSIRQVGNEIVTMIRDNGVGFDDKEVKQGNGLLNMKVRAGILGGDLQITSRMNEGTAISFSLPYPAKW